MAAPRLSEEERKHRKALYAHLYQMHGRFQVRVGGALTIEELERVHEDFHLDKFSCPPHRHEESLDLEIGEIKLKYEANYVDVIIERARA